MRRPLKVVGAHPLHAHRLADACDRITASSSAPAFLRSTSIVAGSGIDVHDHMIGGYPQHHGDFAAQLLWILVVRVDVNSPVGFDVATAIVGPIGACFM